jgi:hypothetical protein
MSAGISGKAMDVMFGRTDQRKVATWLAWTEGRRVDSPGTSGSTSSVVGSGTLVDASDVGLRP